jgi:phosphopantetheinyl transferase (holo-ACP synthase)
MYSTGADTAKVSSIESCAEDAVKEAFMKEAGTGWDNGLAWLDIGVYAEGRGAALRLINGAGDLFVSKKVFAGFSFGRSFAAAFVVVEAG